MSVHMSAKIGDIAEGILLPGDPLRAKFIAENFLENISCYNEVRGMLGFTGTYKGKKVSVQGTGMGVPSISIYANELMTEYGVKKLIRVGTCGSIQDHVKVRDLVIGMAASTDSQINNIRFSGRNYAPTASFTLLKKAYDLALEKGFDPKVGNILSSDTFYHDEPDSWEIWAKFGCLAIEMEAAGLYTLAAKYGVDALTLLTVSDNIITGEITTPEERQTTFTDMIEVALDTLI